MELTKAEIIVLMSLIAQSTGIEALIELLGEEKVRNLDAIAVEMAENTTPKEMTSISTSIINKTANCLLATNE